MSSSFGTTARRFSLCTCGAKLPPELQTSSEFRSAWSCKVCGINIDEIVSRCQQGSSDAFSVLHYAFNRYLHSWLSGRPGLQGLPDDVDEELQETWLKCWTGIQPTKIYQRGKRAGHTLANEGQFRGQCSFITWLVWIAKNVYLRYNELRHRNQNISCKLFDRDSADGDRVLDRLNNVADPAAFDGREVGIQNCVDKLSGRQKKVITMTAAGDSSKEIAAAMGIAASTARATLMQARQRLHKLLTMPLPKSSEEVCNVPEVELVAAA